MALEYSEVMTAGAMLYKKQDLDKATKSMESLNEWIISAKKQVDKRVTFGSSKAAFLSFMEPTAAAQKEVSSKITKVPQNEEGLEAYKRVWIDIFENNFTGLFDSKKFSENYNRLISTELDLLKRWNAITDVMLKSANLPTKQEIEEIYEELHTLKSRISKLESSKKKA